jgi:hypothetical protein
MKLNESSQRTAQESMTTPKPGSSPGTLPALAFPLLGNAYRYLLPNFLTILVAANSPWLLVVQTLILFQ